MYIRIQISIYVSTYICMYTYIYLYINIDTCIDVRIHTYLYVHTWKHIYINVYTHIRFCWRWGKSLPEWISTIIMTYVDDIYWWCKCIFMTYSADMYVDIAGFYIVKTTRRLKLMPHSCGDIYLWHIPRVYILITYSWVLRDEMVSRIKYWCHVAAGVYSNGVFRELIYWLIYSWNRWYW